MTVNQKSVMMVIPHMVGGGAERVAAMLMNEFHRNGFDTTFLLTQAKREAIVNRDLEPEIPLILLQEICGKQTSRVKRTAASVLSHLFEDTRHAVPAPIAYFSFVSQYRQEIEAVRRLLREKPDVIVIAFSQPAIPIVLLAARDLPNRIIISERADPNRLMKKRYGRKFIEQYYGRADAAVFQTDDAKNTYPPCVSEKGVVIPNPIKADLPAPYQGARNKNITTFCRISAQKNLPVLFEAFRMLHQDHPDYMLRIIGDAVNDEGRRIEAQLKQYVHEHQLEAAVSFEPFKANVHEAILEDAMYVNSSDYEGISNAMLEAMAIGMPVVCTDCPIGGAKATIVDGENGLLVPVGDGSALYQAMKRVIEEPELAQRISRNAATLRDELTLESIAKKWMELIWPMQNRMVDSKQTLRQCILADIRANYGDKPMNLETRFRGSYPYMVCRYLKVLRKQEYTCCQRDQSKHRLMAMFLAQKVKFLDRRKNRLGLKLGIEIPIHRVAPGVRIAHPNVILNGYVGEGCVFHGNNVLGNKRTGDRTSIPKLGRNVDVGVGAMIIGNVEIADDCMIGAGAVVTKSFTEPGTVIAGVPAKELRG